ELGPLKVTGTMAEGVPFEAVAPEPLQLRVRPAIAAVRPWLPLQSLQIKAQLDNAGEVERGRPVTLTLEQEAQGATGDQLPSLESMLRSDDFRVYREQTVTDTRLANNGQTLIGKRVEYYTLVPHSGGRLQLPELRLGWWNVATATREASSVPIRTFAVAGESGPFGFSRSASHDGDDWRVFWRPLAGLLLLLIGYWGGVWWRGRPTPESVQVSAPMLPRLRLSVARAAAEAALALSISVRLLDPAPLLRRANQVVVGLTPKSARVYQCAREADGADDPTAWCLAFQQQACRGLQAGAREPLPRMADRIVSLRPGADSEQVLRLMQELDAALYNRQDIDFARWKRDFRRALRPGIGALRSVIANRVRRGHLPALNPEPQGF
ncbi:MAG: BatD family protein, partial [Thiohalocapsa sp.]